MLARGPEFGGQDVDDRVDRAVAKYLDGIDLPGLVVRSVQDRVRQFWLFFCTYISNVCQPLFSKVRFNLTVILSCHLEKRSCFIINISYIHYILIIVCFILNIF